MPEQTPHSHTKLFLWLGLLVAFLIAVSIVAVVIGTPGTGAPVTSEAIRLGEAPRPAFTEATKEKVRASSGFSALVSLTDHGFEPAAVVVARGQAVRFTNNSSQPLRMQIDGVSVDIASQDFLEHTFATVGDHVYSAGGYSGSVRVQ